MPIIDDRWQVEPYPRTWSRLTAMPDDTISLTIDGRPVHVPPGTSVAAAVMIAAGPGFRRSVTGQLRGPLCGMGICYECRLTIDGLPSGPVARPPAAPGWRSAPMPLDRRADLDRSTSSSSAPGRRGWRRRSAPRATGRKVGLVDDNPDLGGQIWRGERPRPSSPEAAAWFRQGPRGRVRGPAGHAGRRPGRARDASWPSRRDGWSSWAIGP